MAENDGHGRAHHLKEPFGLRLPWKPMDPSGEEMKVELTFHFQGHYGEPSIARELVIKKGMKGNNKNEHLLVMCGSFFCKLI